MNETAANQTAPGLAEPKPQGEGWSQKKWLAVISIIFAAHVAIIFAFGEKGEIIPRAVTNAPKFKLANDSDELPALNDPTLFALPHQRDFASAAWLKMPGEKPPSFRFAEPSRWLPLSAENLGATFQQFMRTNYFAGFQLNFKPQPELSELVLPIEPALAQNSTVQMADELAQRKLLKQITPPSLPYNDVLAPSKVQALVDAAGNVSPVLLESSGYKDADDEALKLARTARFAPAKNPTVGQMIFNWRTIPATTTNDNSNAH
jgi:TonB family protein